ncbi:hypothetical protein CONCODRAFT_8301 [Conidiobolus coronatus NRRL 28638]|uniref:BZIP domain-containing protein n=1 Tax=Conidiobolus coronatus (strain ATCC 28846 / CBS 209.66 / NRRL 28638) TaxID=796925 RepID=A0A137P2M5_CONC2|nr:hypothetical protein CONCODRAFT_8301 [Conidiobolus coronatus NRRL 28638]|eukprot:KXN69286.1 hypothetical protein CONCODRAFT_8301 [Conidiobolus coronatus NRRL 28638]
MNTIEYACHPYLFETLPECNSPEWYSLCQSQESLAAYQATQYNELSLPSNVSPLPLLPYTYPISPQIEIANDHYGYSYSSSPTEPEFQLASYYAGNGAFCNFDYLKSLPNSSDISNPIILKSNTSENIHNLFQETSAQPTRVRSKSKTKSQNNRDHNELKYKRNLERNRESTRRCRQRQQMKLQELLSKVKFLTTENSQLQEEAISLKEQIVDIKLILFNIHQHNSQVHSN